MRQNMLQFNLLQMIPLPAGLRLKNTAFCHGSQGGPGQWTLIQAGQEIRNVQLY